jgi:hypothetical protein
VQEFIYWKNPKKIENIEFVKRRLADGNFGGENGNLEVEVAAEDWENKSLDWLAMLFPAGFHRS